MAAIFIALTALVLIMAGYAAGYSDGKLYEQERQLLERLKNLEQ